MADYFVHPQGLCESETIGAKTRVWAFASAGVFGCAGS